MKYLRLNWKEDEETSEEIVGGCGRGFGSRDTKVRRQTCDRNDWR